MELTALRGVGEKTAQSFKKLGIDSVETLLKYIPRTYEVYEEPVRIREIDNKVLVAIDGTVIRRPELRKVKNLQILSTVIKDERGDLLKLTWFNMPFLRNTLQYSARFIFRGRINKKGGSLVMEQPEILSLAQYDAKKSQMQPVYALTKGVTSNALMKAIKQGLSQVQFVDYLNDKLREKYNVIELNDAIGKIHFPENEEELQIARKRMVFDEFFQFIYNMKKLKEKETFTANEHIITDYTLSERVIANLPYELTPDQRRTLHEIRKDMASATTMQRLIQGDVGSGKTILAILSMLDVAYAGRQAALMAPTEVLATQHYESLLDMVNQLQLPISVALLTGSTKAAEKREIYKGMEEGSIQILIGTHTLIQEKAVYQNLALVITDEQHRFGVMQRSEIQKKGNHPHVMVMSATPIPRTLAIILYGDLDISVIKTMPAARLPIKNCVVTKEYRNNAYRFIEKEVHAGRQAYVICPMVEENDTIEAENVVDYAKMLQENLSSDIQITYLHGKMKSEEKNRIMQQFAQQQIQVLVSTTVIEVGINVPNATIMMVENAERFGLASLHQLRGRVGRGKYQSYCIFISSSNDKAKLKRLDILNHSNDGFYIADADMKMRGPGDFFGIRQSGDMTFSLADIYSDGDVLKDASMAVEDFINDGYELIDKRLNDDIVIY